VISGVDDTLKSSGGINVLQALPWEAFSMSNINAVTIRVSHYLAALSCANIIILSCYCSTITNTTTTVTSSAASSRQGCHFDEASGRIQMA
jgi:hypothetical protein